MWLHKRAQSADNNNLGELTFALPEEDAGAAAAAAVVASSVASTAPQSEPDFGNFDLGSDLKLDVTPKLNAAPSMPALNLNTGGESSGAAPFEMSVSFEKTSDSVSEKTSKIAVELPSKISSENSFENLTALDLGVALEPTLATEAPSESFDPASFDFGEPPLALELGDVTDNSGETQKALESEAESETHQTDSAAFSALEIGTPGEDLGLFLSMDEGSHVPKPNVAETELFVAEVFAAAQKSSAENNSPNELTSAENTVPSEDLPVQKITQPSHDANEEVTSTNLMGNWGAGGLDLDLAPPTVKLESPALDVRGGKPSLPSVPGVLNSPDATAPQIQPGFELNTQPAGFITPENAQSESSSQQPESENQSHCQSQVDHETQNNSDAAHSELDALSSNEHSEHSQHLDNSEQQEQAEAASNSKPRKAPLEPSKMRDKIAKLVLSGLVAASGAFVLADDTLFQAILETFDDGATLSSEQPAVLPNSVPSNQIKRVGPAQSKMKKPSAKTKKPKKAAVKLSAQEAPANIKDKAPDEDATEGEKRRVMLEPVSYATLGVNGRFFEDLDGVLQRGESVVALKKFKTNPPSPFTKPEEKALAQEYTARFYLLMGAADKAKGPLVRLCKKSDSTRLHPCLHAARALLSEGDFKGARDLLSHLDSDSPAFSDSESVVNLLQASSQSLARPTVASIAPLVTHLLEDANLSAEWFRQRTIWFARTLYSLPKADRQRVCIQLLRDRREELVQVFSAAETSWNSKTDPLFVPLLNKLAQEFELPAFQINNPQPKSDSEAGIAGLMFYLMTHNPNQAAVNPSIVLANMRLNPVQREIAKILTLNSFLQDHNIGQAGSLLFSRPFYSGKFSYEWHLANARYASHSQSFESWDKALGLLKQAYSTEPQARSDFYFWIIQAKILRLLKKPEAKIALERAWQQALTPQEKGLAATEDALAMKGEGQFAAAFAKTRKMIAQIPYHLPLLQVAAELAGRTGGDPSPFIDRQVEIPDSATQRSIEIPGLSDVSILKMLTLL